MASPRPAAKASARRHPRNFDPAQPPPDANRLTPTHDAAGHSFLFFYYYYSPCVRLLPCALHHVIARAGPVRGHSPRNLPKYVHRCRRLISLASRSLATRRGLRYVRPPRGAPRTTRAATPPHAHGGAGLRICAAAGAWRGDTRAAGAVGARAGPRKGKSRRGGVLACEQTRSAKGPAGLRDRRAGLAAHGTTRAASRFDGGRCPAWRDGGGARALGGVGVCIRHQHTSVTARLRICASWASC